MQVHSLNHRFPLELSLSVDVENQVPALPSSVDASADDVAPIPPQTSSSDEKEMVWLCSICNVPQGDQAMICCDRCDNWCHLRCVGCKTKMVLSRLRTFEAPVVRPSLLPE